MGSEAVLAEEGKGRKNVVFRWEGGDRSSVST